MPRLRMTGFWTGFLSCAAMGLLALGCGGTPKPAGACITVEASPQLNLFDGRSHTVTLYLYALKTPLGFKQVSVEDLLNGAMPAGSNGKPVPITISPGEIRSLDETFPPMTTFVGVVADYYRASDDPEGSLKVLVEAKCGLWSPTILLSPRDILVK